MYIKKVIDGFTKHITDCMFIYLQSDRELMDEYLKMDVNQRNAVNRRLGEAIKGHFNLENGEENSSPRSTLIGKYTEHHK